MIGASFLCFCWVDALTGDPVCLKTALTALLHASSQGGRASGESEMADLILSFIILAPGQLSLTAGVAGADCWLVIAISPGPLPLLDACRCVATGRHMGSATEQVSVFIISIVVAGAVAALGQVQGDAIGAVA